MSLIHDTIKIRLVEQGYLPNYPYHLISDEEMCHGFMHDCDDTCYLGCRGGYFYTTYPCLDVSLQDAYNLLVSGIRYHLDQLINTKDDAYILPDWVYSYMLGTVISIHSSQLDIHDVIEPLNADNIDDIFDADASIACYHASVKRLLRVHTPESGIIIPYRDTEIKVDALRPPTMFGEPHVIKYIRLTDSDPNS